MDSMILVIKHKLLITVNGSPYVLAPSIFPISFHTISLLSTLLFMPQTLQVYPYLLAFAFVISFNVVFLPLAHLCYLGLSFNVATYERSSLNHLR